MAYKDNHRGAQKKAKRIEKLAEALEQHESETTGVPTRKAKRRQARKRGRE
jgi:hypothetical protein